MTQKSKINHGQASYDQPLGRRVSTVQPRSSPAHSGKTDGVVATHDDGHRSGGGNVGHCVGDLVEGLLDIGRDREHVSDVAHGHLLAQVHSRLVVVRRVWAPVGWLVGTLSTMSRNL